MDYLVVNNISHKYCSNKCNNDLISCEHNQNMFNKKSFNCKKCCYATPIYNNNDEFALNNTDSTQHVKKWDKLNNIIDTKNIHALDTINKSNEFKNLTDFFNFQDSVPSSLKNKRSTRIYLLFTHFVTLFVQAIKLLCKNSIFNKPYINAAVQTFSRT